MVTEDVLSSFDINSFLLNDIFVLHRSKGLDRSEISGEKARFMSDLQTIFFQDKSGALTVVEILRTRYSTSITY